MSHKVSTACLQTGLGVPAPVSPSAMHWHLLCVLPSHNMPRSDLKGKHRDADAGEAPVVLAD